MEMKMLILVRNRMTKVVIKIHFVMIRSVYQETEHNKRRFSRRSAEEKILPLRPAGPLDPQYECQVCCSQA